MNSPRLLITACTLGCLLVREPTCALAQGTPPVVAEEASSWAWLSHLDGTMRRLHEDISLLETRLATLAHLPEEQTGERLAITAAFFKVEEWEISGCRWTWARAGSLIPSYSYRSCFRGNWVASRVMDSRAAFGLPWRRHLTWQMSRC